MKKPPKAAKSAAPPPPKRPARAHDPVDLESVELPKGVLELDDAALAEIAEGVACADDLARAWLAHEPKLSGKQVAALCTAAGWPMSAREGRLARDAWVAEGKPRPGAASAEDGPDHEGDTPPRTQAELLQHELSEAMAVGDMTRAREIAAVAKALGLELGALAPDEGKADLSRLSDVELACLRALVTVSEGGVPDDEQAWFLQLLKRVPLERSKVHPAHVELPAGAPAGVVYTVPE